MRLFILVLIFNSFLFNQLLAQMVPRPSIPFKVPENKLDYSNVQNWYAYGKTNSLEKFIPSDLSELNQEIKKASVFYVHPTTYWGADWNPKKKSIPQERVKKFIDNQSSSSFFSLLSSFCASLQTS